MPYVGGKQTMANQIVALMTPHDHYIEPFFGGGSVLFAKPPSKMETVNDIDGDLVTFWRMLRDRPKDLARVCAMTPHSRAEHRAAQYLTDCGDLEGYASPLYDEALTTWERIEVGVRDQASRDRVEVLWTNRLPHPTLLESA